tara:strand:- start:482 stop:982 length:501 start_codon:yes stop_codon:yes gene_type:complete
MSVESSRSRGRRGGYRKPAEPAAVSGPGALSQRTDTGVSVDEVKQMISNDTQGVEGQAEKNVAAANAALTGTSAPGQPVGTTLPAGVLPENLDIFTNGGGQENIQEGVTDEARRIAATGSPMLPPDPLMLVRAMYEIYPTDELGSLLASFQNKPQQRSVNPQTWQT